MFLFSNLNRYYLCHTDVQCMKTTLVPLPIYHAENNVEQHINNYQKQQKNSPKYQPDLDKTVTNIYDDTFDE